MRFRGIHDRTYAGWVDSSGNICVRHYDHERDELGSVVVLHEKLLHNGRADDHDHRSTDDDSSADRPATDRHRRIWVADCGGVDRSRRSCARDESSAPFANGVVTLTREVQERVSPRRGREATTRRNRLSYSWH